MSSLTTELHFDVDFQLKSWCDSVLPRLCSLSAPFLIKIHSYSYQHTSDFLSYTLVIDSTKACLSELTAQRAGGQLEPLSPSDLDKVTVACVSALALAKEKVRFRQKLDVSGLTLSDIFVTREDEVKINLFEAMQSKEKHSLASVLFQAAYGRSPGSEEELRELVGKVSGEGRALVEAVVSGETDYGEMLERVRGAATSNRVFCFNCKLTKASTTAQICSRHAFCSEACFRLLCEATNTFGSQCPLCTVKVPRIDKSGIRLKEDRQGRDCQQCGAKFQAEGGWRGVGSAVSDADKKFCSQACFEASQKPKQEESALKKPEMICANCAKQVTNVEAWLHCERHCLCSVNCLQSYYRGQDLAPHRINGALICYQCLEAYLSEVGTDVAIPDVVFLAKKLQEFKSRREERKQQEANPHASHTCRYVVECPKYISVSLLQHHYFRMSCLFCGRSILLEKNTMEDFFLDDISPLLISCDFRLHGVCSRRCLREKVPRPDSSSPQTIRCPTCPSSLIYAEVLNIAFNARNPTQEVIRRTPIPDHCSQQCSLKYAFDGCRHEVCGKALSRLSTKSDFVACPVCGFRSSLERVVAGEFENKVTHEVKDKDY